MRPKAFTLIETVLVVSLASVLIFAGAESIKTMAPKYRLERAVGEVRSRLTQARYRSIWEGIPVRVRFDPSGFVLEDFDARTNRWRTEERGFMEGVRIEANNNPVFHPVGTVSNLATILVSNSSGTYKITLAISGRIKSVKV